MLGGFVPTNGVFFERMRQEATDRLQWLQCDQIGRFFILLVINFLTKVALANFGAVLSKK